MGSILLAFFLFHLSSFNVEVVTSLNHNLIIEKKTMSRIEKFCVFNF